MLALAVLFVIGIFTLQVLLRGLVISIIWSWHVTTLFSLPEITTSQAISLSFMIGVFTSHLPTRFVQSRSIKDDKEFLVTMLAESFTQSVWILLIGWIIHVLQS